MEPPETGTARIDGAGLYYEVRGEGAPIVLLHDGLLDGRIWDDQFAVFPERYKVIRYDTRGHGRSEPTGGKFSQVEDLHVLLGLLNVRRACLLGASNGGRIATDFALEHPGMVSSLILVTPSLSGYPPSEEKRQRISERFLVGREKGAARWAEAWLDDPFWSPNERHVAARRKLRKLLVEAFHNFSRTRDARERSGPPAAPRLPEIKAPTLIVLGEKDDPDNHAVADILAAGISTAERTVVSDVAHMLNMERPEEFNKLVLRFLEGLEAG